MKLLEVRNYTCYIKVDRITAGLLQKHYEAVLAVFSEVQKEHPEIRSLKLVTDDVFEEIDLFAIEDVTQ